MWLLSKLMRALVYVVISLLGTIAIFCVIIKWELDPMKVVGVLLVTGIVYAAWGRASGNNH